MNWQGYEDGSMEPQHRAEAERLLQRSPEAKRELEGLRKFIGDVRAAGRREAIPYHRFDRYFPQRVGSRPMRRVLFVLIPSIAIAAAWRVASLPVAVVDNASPTPPVSMKLPPPDLGPNAHLSGTEAGSYWTKYRYRFEGAEYSLLVSPVRSGAVDGETWYARGLCYQLSGPDKAGVAKLGNVAKDRLVAAGHACSTR